MENEVVNFSKGVLEATWVGDSDASGHMVNSLAGEYNAVDLDANIKLGDGRIIKAMKKRIFKGLVRQKDGSTMDKPSQYHRSSQEWYEAFKWCLLRRNWKIKFDQKFGNANGCTMAGHIKPKTERHYANTASAIIQK
jgi:hypothetical protein